jgi:hypothetical protein
MPPPEQLGTQPLFVGRPHDPDRVGRVGGDVDNVRLGGRNGADDRREIDRIRRIAAMIDNLEAHRDSIGARAVGRHRCEIGVRADDGDRLQLGFLFPRDLEKATGDFANPTWSDRQHGKIIRVIKPLVDGEREQTQQDPFPGNHHRHDRHGHIGAVAGNDQIDIVDI